MRFGPGVEEWEGYDEDEGASSWRTTSSSGREPAREESLEWADLGRFRRRVVRGFVRTARADEGPSFRTLIPEHLGVPVADLPIVEEHWPGYEHVNVQTALDIWLAEPGREHQLVGMTDYRHRGSFGLGDLLSQPDRYDHGHRPGQVSWVPLPAGPDGATLPCVRVAVVLVSQGEDRLVLLVRGADPESEMTGVAVDVMATREGLAAETGSRLRDLALEHNVLRGQVVSFGTSMYGERGGALRFHSRHRLPPGSLVLPERTFADLRRQVVGVARNRDRLRAAGQHLKRGLLLYGPPGVGKTHTVRYLIGELADTTVVELTGETLRLIKHACSIARSLQPALIVVEDVDLIAEHRDHHHGQAPLLFLLLNEMDGLDEDADVVFLLTTNRADLLEPALAARPGRVDQAVHIDLPDRDARRRLVELYRGGLELDTARLDGVLERTEGVTASFLKELLRRSAVVAAERDHGDPGADDDSGGESGGAAPGAGADQPVRVSADDLDTALADLLDTRNQMTRAVLGFRPDQGPPSMG